VNFHFLKRLCFKDQQTKLTRSRLGKSIWYSYNNIFLNKYCQFACRLHRKKVVLEVWLGYSYVFWPVEYDFRRTELFHHPTVCWKLLKMMLKIRKTVKTIWDPKSTLETNSVPKYESFLTLTRTMSSDTLRFHPHTLIPLL